MMTTTTLCEESLTNVCLRGSDITFFFGGEGWHGGSVLDRLQTAQEDEPAVGLSSPTRSGTGRF